MENKILIHPETGEILQRDVRPLELEYKGEKIMVDMPGWYPSSGNDGIFSREDLKTSDNALKILKARFSSESNAENFLFGKRSLA